MLSIYQAVDDAVGRLLDGLRLEDTTLIICAAHGMNENVSQEHFTRPIMDRVNRRFPEIVGTAQHDGGPRPRSVMRALRQRLPARLQHAVADVVPAAIRDFVVDRAVKGYEPFFDIKLVALGHNIVRGAAGASVLNAELMATTGRIEKP